MSHIPHSSTTPSPLNHHTFLTHPSHNDPYNDQMINFQNMMHVSHVHVGMAADVVTQSTSTHVTARLDGRGKTVNQVSFLYIYFWLDGRGKTVNQVSFLYIYFWLIEHEVPDEVPDLNYFCHWLLAT